MHFKADKKVYIRRALFVLLIAVTAAFQHTAGAIPALFGAKAMILIPAVVAVSMFQKSMSGLAFGTFAGILWDFATVRGDGFFSVMLALTGYFTCVLMTYYLRNNIYSAAIISFAANLIINTCYWFVFIFFKGYDEPLKLLLDFYLPSAIYSSVYILLYYGIVSLIMKLTVKDKELPYGR